MIFVSFVSHWNSWLGIFWPPAKRLSIDDGKHRPHPYLVLSFVYRQKEQRPTAKLCHCPCCKERRPWLQRPHLRTNYSLYLGEQREPTASCRYSLPSGNFGAAECIQQTWIVSNTCLYYLLEFPGGSMYAKVDVFFLSQSFRKGQKYILLFQRKVEIFRLDTVFWM